MAVCGLANLETTVPIDGFPLDVRPRGFVYGAESHVAGVACNVAAGLAALGTPVRLTALAGTDAVGRLVRAELAAIPGLELSYVDLPRSPQTVVLLAPDGGRVVLSDVAGAPTTRLPDGVPDLAGCSAFVPIAVAATEPALARAAELGVRVCVDVAGMADVDEPRKAPFCAAAEVLAMSDSAIPCGPEEWLRRLGDRYGTPVIVLGMGARGALLARDAGRRLDHVPAVPGPVRSTVGAGDALWACFLDGYLRGADPLWCLRRAVVFAGHKVATVGGTQGLLSAAELAARFDVPPP